MIAQPNRTKRRPSSTSELAWTVPAAKLESEKPGAVAIFRTFWKMFALPVARGAVIGLALGLVPLVFLLDSRIVAKPLRFAALALFGAAMPVILTFFAAIVLSITVRPSPPAESRYVASSRELRIGRQRLRWTKVTGWISGRDGDVWLVNRQNPPIRVVLPSELSEDEFRARFLPRPLAALPLDFHEVVPWPSMVTSRHVWLVLLLSVPWSLIVSSLTFLLLFPAKPIWLVFCLGIFLGPGVLVVGVRDPRLLLADAGTRLLAITMSLPALFQTQILLAVLYVRAVLEAIANR